MNAQPGDLGAGQSEGPGAGAGARRRRFAQAEAASATNMASMAVFIAGMVVLV